MFRALIALLMIWTGAVQAASLKTVTLDDGRFYLIAVPDGVERPPLILALHGGGGNPEQFERDAGLAKAALKAGFAIAYPAGSGRTRLLTWNAIYCCAYAQRQRIDDVAFLDRVVADAGRQFGIDSKRIFVTGMSNGSMMAETYGALRPGIVRAIAGVSGTLDLRDIQPRGGVPLLHIHGTDDENVLYQGGVGPDSIVGTDVSSVEDLLEAFLSVAPRGLVYSETVLNPANDGMTTDRLAWSENGIDWVVHLRVNGGGHNWPGGARGQRKGATKDFAAATEVIRFFKQFK
jgi:polyhydroxybutyrate depolymerase